MSVQTLLSVNATALNTYMYENSAWHKDIDLLCFKVNCNMRAVALAALLLVTSHCAMAAVGDVFAVLQDPTGVAGTGDVTATSETHWKFRWPLVETTADPIDHVIKVIIFPDGGSGSGPLQN